MKRDMIIAIAAGGILLAAALIVETRHFFFRQPAAPVPTVAEALSAGTQQSPANAGPIPSEMAEELRYHWAIKYAKTPEEFETAKAAWLQWQQQHPSGVQTESRQQ